jgi:hypothetical protein
MSGNKLRQRAKLVGIVRKGVYDNWDAVPREQCNHQLQDISKVTKFWK